MTCGETLALAFVAATLKFSAVPAAAFELLSMQRRTAIEEWLLGKLPQLVKAVIVTSAVLYVSVVLLVKAGPYMLITLLLFNRVIAWIALWVFDFEGSATFMVTVFAFVMLSLIAAVFEKWFLPEAWILSLGYPFEAVSAWANSIAWADWLLPDYSGREFLDNYRKVFQGVEEWMWEWTAFLYGSYFFLARGAMVLMVALIQVLLVAGIVFGTVTALAIPPYLFMKFSDLVRQRLHIEKDRIPVGAFFFWAAGETIEYGLKAHETFWN